MFDDSDDYEDEDDEFEEMNNMSMDEFLEYLYENRANFFGPFEEFDEEIEYELRDKLNGFLNKPLDYAFTTINNKRYSIALSYGSWVVYKN